MPSRWRIVVEYDGAAFAGWQLQPDVPTVQGALEEALAPLLGHAVRVHGAGRTDAGVHALGQVAAFDTEAERSPTSIRDGLNARLPPAVACLEAALAPAGFDPRRSPHAKQYRYRWVARPSRSPLRQGRAWHVRRPLEVAAMAEAAALLVGTHDFSSFRAQGCAATHPVRTVAGAEVLASDDEVHLVVHGTGFLRHMIRIVAGTLHDIGRGARPPSWMGDVLEARDRRRAGRTAPAEGLCLEWVRYLEP